MNDASALLTVRDVARLLALSERSVWRMSDAGKLPVPVRIGAAVRWRRAEIEQWISEGCPVIPRGARRCGSKTDRRAKTTLATRGT